MEIINSGSFAGPNFSCMDGRALSKWASASDGGRNRAKQRIRESAGVLPDTGEGGITAKRKKKMKQRKSSGTVATNLR